MYLTYELNQTEAKLLKLKQDSSNSFNRTPGETTNISSQNNILKKELEKDLDFIVEYLSCVYQNEINENNETLTAQEKRLIRTLNEEIL